MGMEVNDKLQRSYWFVDVRSIPLTELLPPLYPVRRVADDEKMAELVRSIKVNGLLHPLVVIPENSQYRILAGHRRFIAISGIGWEEVPCNVIEARRQADRLVSIDENLIRESVNPVDLGWYFRHLCESEHMTQTEIGQLLGKSLGWVNTYVKLTRMSEPAQLAVQEGQLPAQGALLIDSIENEAVRETLARDAITRGYSYHQIQTARAQYEENKEIIDQAIETVQSVRTEQAAEASPLSCFGCGIRAVDRPGGMFWLCAGCTSAIQAAQVPGGRE